MELNSIMAANKVFEAALRHALERSATRSNSVTLEVPLSTAFEILLYLVPNPGCLARRIERFCRSASHMELNVRDAAKASIREELKKGLDNYKTIKAKLQYNAFGGTAQDQWLTKMDNAMSHLEPGVNIIEVLKIIHGRKKGK